MKTLLGWIVIIVIAVFIYNQTHRQDSVPESPTVHAPPRAQNPGTTPDPSPTITHATAPAPLRALLEMQSARAATQKAHKALDAAKIASLAAVRASLPYIAAQGELAAANEAHAAATNTQERLDSSAAANRAKDKMRKMEADALKESSVAAADARAAEADVALNIAIAANDQEQQETAKRVAKEAEAKRMEDPCYAAAKYGKLVKGMDRDQVIESFSHRSERWDGPTLVLKNSAGIKVLQWTRGDAFVRLTFLNDELQSWTLFGN